MKKVRSIGRLQARQLEKKVVPAIKILSKHMFSTKKVDDRNFSGYKIPSGDFVDNNGVKWQLQVYAVKSKKLFIKNNEIKPIIPKWALMFKLRVFTKIFIDKIFGDEIIQ